MPQSKPRRRAGHGEIIPPLSKQERIHELLKIQLETFPAKELTPEEIVRWEQDLDNYPMDAIEWAFEEHRRMAMFFPVPAQILQLCGAWEPSQRPNTSCSPECRARHGKGYGETDVIWLFHHYNVKRQELGRDLSNIEWNLLLDQLDDHRGRVPEWRQ